MDEVNRKRKDCFVQSFSLWFVLLFFIWIYKEKLPDFLDDVIKNVSEDELRRYREGVHL